MRLLTEDEWGEFKVIFDSIYPDLFIRLLEGRKSLTLTDEKVVCLLRLHCNTQEIAIRLGISQNSANTARSRLRKRLGLEHHEYIEEFLLRHSTPNAFDERYRKRRN
jgi:DNA-binding CsgD family transcriptional regulator